MSEQGGIFLRDQAYGVLIVNWANAPAEAAATTRRDAKKDFIVR